MLTTLLYYLDDQTDKLKIRSITLDYKNENVK